MARFPDQSAFGASAPMDAENIDALNQVAEQAPNTNALEVAKADSRYLVQTKALRDALAGEGEPDGLRDRYEPLFRQAFDGSAAQISDPQRRESWAQSRSPDFDGHLSATSDRAFNLTREREITGAAAQLDAMRDLAAQTADPAKRSEFIQAANGLIFGLQSAGYIEEAAAKEKQKAWAQDFALAAFSKRPAAEQVRWLEGDARGRDAGKGELIDFVPADARESLLQTAQLNLRKETLTAQSAAALEQHNLKAQINDDLAAILKEGKGIDSLALEKVQTILGPDVTRNWRETREDFATIRSNTDDLYALTDTQLLERLYSLRPTGDMRDDPRKGAVFVEIFNQAERLLDARLTDPAKSVEDDPIVRAVQEGQAQSYDPQSARDLFAARLAAQTRAGIERDAQSPITREEALELTAPLRGQFSSQEDRDRASEATVAEFKRRFGSDAEIAFFYAFGVHVAEATTKFMSARFSNDGSEPSHALATAGLNDMGEAPSYLPDVPAKGPKATPSKHILKAYSLRPNDKDAAISESPDEDGDDDSYEPIPEKAIKAIRENPALATEFDRKYDKRHKARDADRKPNFFDQFDNEPDAGEPDLQERFRLNVANSWLRETIAGAIFLEITRKNDPAGYEQAVSQLARYDLMRPARSPLEMSAAFSGNMAASYFSPEALIPGSKVIGALAKRILAGVAAKAGASLLTETVAQNLNIRSGVQEKIDDERAGKKMIVKGGKAAAKEIAKDVMPRRQFKKVEWMF